QRSTTPNRNAGTPQGPHSARPALSKTRTRARPRKTRMQARRLGHRMALLANEEITAPVAQPEPQRRRRTWRDFLEPRYITLAIAAIAVAYLALVPVGTMVYASLQSDFLGFTPSTWTLHNYAHVFTDAGFGQLVLNSFVYAAATAVVCTVVGFGLA